MLRGTVERVRFWGTSLEGNALGDPVERELIVYLPHGYEASTRRYPVVVLLTGYASTNASLLNFKAWEPNLLERYERLQQAGCADAIFVLPDCFTRLGGSQFIDSLGTGRYQSYIADDIIDWIDQHYRTIPEPGARAIIGKSSGGFGALRMGMERPDRFGVIGSHAGDAAFALSVQPRFVEVAPIYERFGGPQGFLAERGDSGPRSQREFHAMEILALSAAYAPVPQGDMPHGELPFDPYTAELIPEIWERWLRHDPVEMLRTEPNLLEKSKFVFLDAGKSDEYGLQFGARMLAQRLNNSGVNLHHEEFEGGHMGTSHRYDVSLPRIIGALASDFSAGQRERL